MRAQTTTALFALLSLLALPTGIASAQLVLGPGPDASTLPKGAVRTTFTADHGLDRGRFNNGDAEPLGAAFSVATFGSEQHGALAALTSAFASIGVPNLAPSLGAVSLNLRQRVFTPKLGVDVGLFDWLTVAVDVPVVRTRAEALLRLNGAEDRATAGLNPLHLGTAVGASNAATIQSYQSAVAALTARRNDCIGNAGSHPECGIILAESGSVDALNTMSSLFATRLGVAYGGTGFGNGLPFVPMAGSLGEVVLTTRADSLREAFERYGVTDIDSASMIPLGAQTPLNATDLALMVGAGFVNGGGFGARPMTRTAFQQIGDVDLSARVRVFDTFEDTTAALAIRHTFGVTYRIGSGYPDRADNFIDVGSGTGADGFGVRSLTDVRLREKLYATLLIGWSASQSYDREVRLPRGTETAWLEAFLTDVVTVDPGALLELGIAPRYQLTEHFQLGAEWRWRSKAADAITPQGGALAPQYGETFTALPEAFVDGNAWNESRLSWSVSYSTLAGVAAGRGRLPIEVGYTHDQVVSNARGIVPQRFTDRIQLRYYARFFGR